MKDSYGQRPLSRLVKQPKMLSLSLIIGVAAAASFVLLVIGVASTVVFERRRYRKYIQRHYAGTEISTSSMSIQNGEDMNQTDYAADTLSTRSFGSPTDRVTLPCSGSTCGRIRTAANHSDLASSSQAGGKSLRRTLDKPIRKKPANRRRLRRAKRSVVVVDSPLSVITEQSDNTKDLSDPTSVSPLKTVAAAPSALRTTATNHHALHYSQTQQSAWRVPFLRSSSVSSLVPVSRPASIPKSSSVTSSVMSAPEDPLPPLPTIGSNVDRRARLKPHASHNSIQSVSSSILESPLANPGSKSLAVEKTRSRALQDFDFDLSPIIKPCPTVQSLSLRQPELQSADKVYSQVNPGHGADFKHTTPGISHPMSWSDAISPVTRRAESLTTGPPGRHSMFEKAPNPLCSFIVLTSDHSQGDIATTSARPATVGWIAPSQNLKRRSDFDSNLHQIVCTERQPGQARHEKKPVHILTSVTSPNTARSMMDPVKQSSSPLQPIANQKRLAMDLTTLQDDAVPWSSESSFNRNLRHLDWLRLNPNPSRRSSPATPDAGRHQAWRFDLVPPDTPKASFSSSPLRCYDSPILPSPIQTTSAFRSRLQTSQIRGPRGPRCQSPSPLRPKTRSTCDSHGQTIVTPSSGVNRSGSTDLRKSVLLLRSMDSDGSLYTSKEAPFLPHMGKADTGREAGSPGKQVKNTSVPVVTGATPCCRSPLSLPPSPSPRAQGLTPQLDSQRDRSATHSMTSTGGTSIWEDASVHEETPELVEQALTPPRKLQSLTNGATKSPVEDGTPRTKVEDYEAYENFIQNYGKALKGPGSSPSWLGVNFKRNKIGLGLTFAETTGDKNTGGGTRCIVSTSGSKDVGSRGMVS